MEQALSILTEKSRRTDTQAKVKTSKVITMYAITRSLIRSTALCQGIQKMQITAPARQVTLKVVSATEAVPKETFDEKNIRLGREMSPHLTIYKPQLTSMLSITHRGTGFALTGYAWILGLGALMSSHDISHYCTIIEGLHMGSATLIALKFVLAFPAAFHTCCGVRHLFWDTGRFLKITEVYLTGYVTLAISAVLSAILACL
ncbi:succinate dehydrogenase cytochrome b560 subunit, mitochondrial [Eurosta solidaginis]|uniref:succinate dehydrogenase cytochrome b560 subunit, mitochondrial n=1 Tax=Eurosta solidaginis TaxID=178769 RepID=UPI003530626C